MARILGAVATSHSPTIGFALDRQKQGDPVWAPIFEAFKPLQNWLEEKKPDALVLTYNDHITSFFFDHYSHFALGIGESFPVADEWLISRGALSANIKKIHQSYYLPTMTGIATAIYENETADPTAGKLMAESNAAYREHMGQQLARVEKLQGTYPFTVQLSVKAYRLNKFLHSMVEPEHRRKFLENEEALYEARGLSAEERDLVRHRDWPDLIHYGVIFFMLEKLGAVVGTSNLHIYAAMRGQTLEDFQKTRNAPGALYSVAGGDAKQFSWDKGAPSGKA